MPEYTGEITHVELADVPLWLIAAFPFLGAVINAAFGRWFQRQPILKEWQKRLHIGSVGVSVVAVGVMLAALSLSIYNFARLVSLEPGHRHLMTHGWQMLRIGSLDINFSFAMDTLGGVMALVVTGVGTLIHIYALSYMETEPSYWRFFTYLNLFIFAMLLLVLGDNFIVMFFGWEGVGLCSYLLIGFWYKDYKKATAGMKAFVVNRIGDFGFVCGMALLFWGLGGSWLADSGDYQPDYRARFIPIVKTELAHHGGEAAAGSPGEGSHGEGSHGEGSPGAAPAPHSTGAPAGQGPHGDLAPQGAEPARPGALPLRGAPLEGALAQGPRRHEHGGPENPPAPPADLPDVPHRAGMPAHPGGVGDLGGGDGFLTMTTHPGSRIYVAIASLEQLQGSRGRLKRCSDRIAPDCYEVAPFVRKPIAAGLHQVVIEPGDGASVSGDGNEVAGFHARVLAGRETVLAPVGSTLTFREIHDQLVVQDAQGKTFLKDALKSKTAWGMALITLSCLLFFVGATGKSAQIPLYVWLPDAMAGPTPVSALIHAATMVTAGVYMVARLNFLFGLSPTASGVVAGIGALTAIFAATMGFFQYDIKKVLAYSTVSQLGFMFIGVGVGAYWAGVFHLVTHAFFKGCLFLASGSVIHGMHAIVHDEAGSQDMRNMGGLKRVMPHTARTYWLACMAITAVPPGLAGFWSKDEILWKAFNTQHTLAWLPGSLIYAVGLAAAFGTSFYMWRSYYLTFEGKHAKKAIAKKVHESPAPMTWVLWALASLSVVAGVVMGISSHLTHGLGEGVLPHEPLLEAWLHPVTAHNEAVIADGGYGLMYGLMALSVAGAIGFWWLAKSRYGAGRDADWAEQEQRLPGFQLLHNKYWVDEIYAATIVRGFIGLRRVFSEMDRWIVDGLVNGVGVAGRATSWVAGVVDKYGVDGVVDGVAQGILRGGQRLRMVQTGRIQNYIYGILGGVAVLAILQYFIG